MAPQGVLDKLLDFGFSNIDLWRSEEMEAVRLLVPTESAHDTVAALGEIGLLQFKDMNEDKSAFQRTYANQVPGKHQSAPIAAWQEQKPVQNSSA